VQIPVDQACSDDWLAVYEPQSDNLKYLMSVYVQGQPDPLSNPVPSGSVVFNLSIPEGTYEIRYLVNRKPLDVLRTIVKVTNSSTMPPAEQLFAGITIGLGAKAVNFGQCIEDANQTLQTFESAFQAFADKKIIAGLQLLGAGLRDFDHTLAACNETDIAKAIEKFIADLIACTQSQCEAFVIDIAVEVLVVYERFHEIFRDIAAAHNDFAAQAYQEAGIHIGDMIQAVISFPSA